MRPSTEETKSIITKHVSMEPVINPNCYEAIVHQPIIMENSVSLFFSQLKAMLKRNLLLKRREKRKTTAEVLLPLYSLGVLILMKILIPNPNFPVVDKPRGEAKLFDHFYYLTKYKIAIVPNTTYVQEFLSNNVNELWKTMNLGPELSWSYFPTSEELLTAYWLEPRTIPLAVIFDGPNPLNESLKYEIRINPSFFETPSTTELFSSPALCRQSSGHWSAALTIENRETCPVNEYYYSGFVALQALLDYAKIKNDTGRNDTTVPHLLLEMFPKEAFTGNWMVAFRVVVPLYMVMALSQFVAYLLILIVGEKENKIKEGMKIMGLKDSVFWLSWFIIYGIFVLFLSTVCCILVFALRVFQNTNLILIFLLVLLYSLSIIMFGFMITPFFDKSRTAGVLGNFSINILSLLYFIQVFVDEKSSTAFWIISLISSTGFALAMDKALVMDLAGEGVNFNNLWSGPGIPFGGSLIMMALDIVLYGLLAFYLDSVIPSEHGTKRSPLFCFRPSYWCRKRIVRVPLANGNSVGSFNNGEEGNSDIEQVPREMKGREAIKIVDLYKSFQNCRKPEIKAVNGINLTIYEGQITAVLGHNGAGKTTLFNILTGLTAPSSGTAYIFGYDIRDADDMDQIRRMTGVCPQHDILFDNLTPREHLDFFAAVKGIPSAIRDFEVNRTLKDIDLTEKASTFAKHLSGGQKRKLSVGIAVIGDPKIIILDEPTAGVDPYSRRHMWSVLQNRRHGKVILLTTHFMDEADILADRKAVVSKGKLRCCGSSLFLKNKFGIGYHLTLVLEGISREHAITKLVISHVPKAEKARRHGRELSFILPHNAVNNFASLFSAIEQEINSGGKLGISSYGVSMTTLEEVFLHLERDEEAEGSVENLSKKIVRNRALSRSLSLQSKSTSYQSLQNESNSNHTDPRGMGDMQLPGLEVICETKSPIVGLGLEKIETNPSILQTFIALLTLRVLRLIRDIQKLYFMILLPLGLAAIGLYLNSIQGTHNKMKVLNLNTSTYNGGLSNFLIHNGTEQNLDYFIDTFKEVSSKKINTYNGNFSLLLNIAPHMAALNINVVDFPKTNITVIYNDTLQHSLPIIINMIDNTIYRLLMDTNRKSEWQPIEVRVFPFQQTVQPEEFNVGVFSTSLFLGMMFILIPVSLAIDMVYDREIKAKNQLRVNGLSFSMYFVTYFVVLAGLMILISAALLVIILLFDIPSLRGWPALCTLGILLLLHCPASILFSTCISYIFDKTDSALSILPNIATLVGMVPFFLVFTLDMFRIGGKAAYALHVFFSLVNTMYIPYGAVYYIQRVYLMCTDYRGCTAVTLGDYMTHEIIIMIVGILLHLPLWFFILMIVDIVKAGGKVSDAFKVFKSKNVVKVDDVNELSDIGENEDSDVKVERQKVKDIINTPPQNPPVVVVHNLHKEYRRSRTKLCEACKRDEESKTKVAVQSLSLGIDAGEVFGLLGHNGAGKTTTMRIIIAEEAPTRGRVQIGGNNITCSLDKTFQLLGYCPQHDALWKNITVREHLECYAAIRGVPFKDISRVVELYLSGLQIEEHASKQTQHCSGGTRRKLSFAMAMVGNPKVVLLDEPSTGMDPRSKRFLWDTILASFQGSKGAILTTHSMEEADALCSRVGIMVKGELRCLGSTQHLKNLYGAGYTLEMKLSGGDRTPTTSSVDKLKELKEFVNGLFPEATLQETFADRLVFSVPQQSVPSLANCFSELEKVKTDLQIEEYSFSQTTLEQVFLKFAQYDEVNNSE